VVSRFARKSVFLTIGTLGACLGIAYGIQQHRDGYKDTALIPGQIWHVHDSDRPYPPEVTPGATLGAPPSDAIVLFDGTSLSHFCHTDSGDEFGNETPPSWKLDHGTLEVVSGKGYLFTKEKFGDCQLHVEWQEDAGVTGRGQGRGNSGVFLMSRYEVQVLDSYHSATYADGQAGALYGQWPPLVNPIRKPGEWQTYDIVFKAPKWNGDTLVEPAYITVFFNGVLIHDHQKLNGPTAHRDVMPYVKQSPEERLALQDHGPSHPLRFRNIWVRKLKGYDQPEAK
jgi:hypothetical protein